MTKHFNLRVYGLLMNERQEVLVSDEMRFGRAFTKFPGGGLEWGEGLKDALVREIKEELGIACSVGELFYVNDFFQASAFRDEDQLFSFYYLIQVENTEQVQVSNHTWPLKKKGEKFRWVSLALLSSDLFTFPIDKVVADKLRLQAK